MDIHNPHDITISWIMEVVLFSVFPEVFKLVLGQILMSVRPEFVPFLGDWLAFKIACFSKRGEGGQQWAMLENVGILTKTENRKRRGRAAVNA